MSDTTKRILQKIDEHIYAMEQLGYNEHRLGAFKRAVEALAGVQEVARSVPGTALVIVVGNELDIILEMMEGKK
jgi:hypothetical protein